MYIYLYISHTCSTLCAYAATLSLFLPPLMATSLMTTTEDSSTYLWE